MKKIFSVFLFLNLALFIHISQWYVMWWNDQSREIVSQHPQYIYDSDFLKLVSLGHDVLMADFMWMKMVQYIGGNARDFRSDVVYAYIDTVTDLDPKFEYAYQIGQLMLPSEGNIENAIDISHKAMVYNPQNWRFPFQLGFMYHFYVENYEKSAQFYERASKLPGVSQVAQTLAASARGKASKHEAAFVMWKDIYETTDNDATRDLAEKRVIREGNFILLEQARKEYMNTFNKDIEKIEDLVKTGFLLEMPQDPEAIFYVWNSSKQRFEVE